MPPGVKKMPPRRMGFGLPGALSKEKEAKRKCRKGDTKRGLFEKSPLLNSRKNFPAADAGTLGVCTQSNVSAGQPHRKVPPPEAVSARRPPECRANVPKNYALSSANSRISRSVFSQPRHGSVIDFPYSPPSGFCAPSSRYDSTINPLTNR